MHVSDFKADLQTGKDGERIALEVLCNITENYAFQDVSDVKEMYHKGDIIAYKDDESYYLDVKNDSKIHATCNILCEDKIFYRRNKEMKEGFMASEYDYLVIVSQPEKKIYIINFDKLKKHYKEGRRQEMHYSWQYSICYLYPLEEAYKHNMVEAVIEYDNEESTEYYPLFCTRYISYLN